MVKVSLFVPIGILCAVSVFLLSTTILSIVTLVRVGIQSPFAHPEIDASLCPSPLCVAGAAFAVDGMPSCKYYNHSTTKRCESECYEDGAVAHCNGLQECVATNATQCLGYCEVPADSEAPFSANSSWCTGKLTFKGPLKQNTSEDLTLNTLAYSNYDPECYIESGCMWFSTILHFFYFEGATNITMNAASMYSCLDVIEAPDTGCLRFEAYPIPENFSSTFYRLQLDAVLPGNISHYHFQSTACAYTYACAKSTNTSIYTDPDRVEGAFFKRSLLGVEEEAGYEHLLRKAAPAFASSIAGRGVQ